MHYRSTGRSRWVLFPGLILVLLGALLLPACNDTSTNIPDVARGVIDVTVEPNPVIGLQNILTGSVSASYIVKLRELNGLGGEIQFINSTVFDPETGLQVATDYYDSASLVVFVGTSRIEPLGEMDVTKSASYVLPDLRVDADLVVAVQFLDDRGNLFNRSILVRVVTPPAE
ncbi:MAG: hypothetical protein PVJ73_07530 [Acidobacteriota bacterium]|jgi:hypothetical protein